jgi:carboxypeptidase Taq
MEELRKQLTELAHLNAAVGLLVWDQEVFMPSGAAGIRADVLSTLQGNNHSRFVEEIGPVIKRVSEGNWDQDSLEYRNIKRLRKDLERQEKIPKSHVMAIAKATSEAYHAWVEARELGKFELFAPSLQRLVDLRKQEAQLVGYEENPYDALLDTYEPGLKASTLESVFTPFKLELGSLLHQIAQSRQIDDTWLCQAVSEKKQSDWSEQVLSNLGFDFNKGRQDVSVHPFTLSLHPTDVRLTTRIDVHDIRDILYSSIHEAGHGIYEQGLNPAFFGFPSGEACSLGIHESQSRLWENNVGRSLEFWECFFPSLARLYPDELKGKTAEDMFKAVNKVEANYIRIAADELTYHFHILLRTELENDLINSRLAVHELPEAWNAKVKEYLGLTVNDPRQGVLQDIHWSHGSIGYFPTYSLGSFYAAQFMAQAQMDLPSLNQDMARGHFGGLKTWLNEKIHSHGRSLNAEEICTAVTGSGLDVSHFIRYAKQKFGHVYGIQIS